MSLKKPKRGISQMDWARTAQALALSPREVCVARLMLAGKKSAAIARQLGLSAKTVETHRARMYKKLGVHDRASFVLRIVQSAAL